MAKNLLKESVVRRWGSLAKTSPLMESFIEDRADQFKDDDDDDSLEEDNFDKTGRGPHREGAGKNGEQSGIASNQGKEAKSTPDGKLQIPGTGYAGDHKNTSKSPSAGSTDGGTQLQGKGNVTENRLTEMPGEEEEFEDEDSAMPPAPGGDDMGMGDGDADDMGAMPPAPEMGGAEGGADIEGLVSAIAQAITAQTGVEVSVAGGGVGGDDMGMDDAPVDDMGGMPPAEGPPMGAEPPADMGMPDMGGDDYEEEEVVENNFSLSEVDDAAFSEEASNRGYKRGGMQEGADVQEEGAEVQEEAAKVAQEAMIENIARKVAARLVSSKKPKAPAKKTRRVKAKKR